MKAYYTTPNDKGRRTFLYLTVDIEDAKRTELFAGIKNYEGDKELHIALNGTFDRYIAKRLQVPLVVQICQTRKELEAKMELLGVYL